MWYYISFVVPVLLSVTLALFTIDKLVHIPNVYALVKRPFKEMECKGRKVPAPVLYIPSTTKVEHTDETDGEVDEDNLKNEAPVFVMFPGNPGVAEFYTETIRSVHRHSKGHYHVYATGHAGHGLVVDDAMMKEYYDDLVAKEAEEEKKKNSGFRTSGMTLSTTDIFPPISDTAVSIENVELPLLPQFDGNRLKNDSILGDEKADFLQSVSGVGGPFSLRDQIEFKLTTLVMLRARHPKSKFIFAGNSMGSHLILECLRTFDRMYVLKHYGSEGLEKYDKGNILSVSEVEGDNSDFGVFLNVPSYYNTHGIPDSVTQVLFSIDEMAPWMSLIDDMPTPSTDNINNSQFDTSFASDWVLQTQMLMGTVMRIADTPNGSGFLTVSISEFLVDVALSVVSLLPGFIKRSVVYFNTNPFVHAHIVASIRLMVNLHTLKNVVNLASHEMYEIRSLDTKLLLNHAKRVVFYMVDGDGWAPMVYTDYLARLSQKWREKGWVSHRVFVDKLGLEHAFVVGGSEKMGKKSYEFISEALLKDNSGVGVGVGKSVDVARDVTIATNITNIIDSVDIGEGEVQGLTNRIESESIKEDSDSVGVESDSNGDSVGDGDIDSDNDDDYVNINASDLHAPSDLSVGTN